MRIAVLPSVLALLVLGAPVSAQCSDLTVTGSGAPGTTLTFDLTGAAANAPAFLAVGPDTGTTTIGVGSLGTLTLGLARPFAILPMGMTDGNGDVSVSFAIPQASIPQTTLNGQGFTVEFQPPMMGAPSLDFCESDVESFSIGS